MMRKTARLLEVIGAILVLASAGWELFIERTFIDIQQDEAMFRIENKLDYLWIQVGAIRDKIDPDKVSSSVSISPFDASKEWKMSGDRHELEAISRQVAYAKAFRGFLFLLGSIMLIVARRDELLRKSHTAG
jgi:hypothetical protein